MARTENVELTVVCLLRQGQQFLLQVMERDDLSEFLYIPDGEAWRDVLR